MQNLCDRKKAIIKNRYISQNLILKIKKSYKIAIEFLGEVNIAPDTGDFRILDRSSYQLNLERQLKEKFVNDFR